MLKYKFKDKVIRISDNTAYYLDRGYLKDKNILIECQGKQHYIWQKGLQPTYHNFLLQKHHDWLKRKFCIDNNIKLIYINYWDFSSWQNNKIGEILEKEI
jgi:hypothetical protein